MRLGLEKSGYRSNFSNPEAQPQKPPVYQERHSTYPMYARMTSWNMYGYAGIPLLDKDQPPVGRLAIRYACLHTRHMMCCTWIPKLAHLWCASPVRAGPIPRSRTCHGIRNTPAGP